MLLGSNYRNDAVEKLYGDRIGDSSIIFTPWDTVENMLDLIPEDFWTPDVTILDMYCKSGRFLVGAFRKLYNSPYLAYLSESQRTLHILNKQLFGLCADMTCMLLSEANLYGHAQYGKKHIKLVDTYDYNSVVKQRKDGIINRTLEGKFGQMKFDLVIGNPPYNKDAYIDFVEIGHKLATQYSCWVTPAKWQAKGGQKNEDFRKNIVPYMSKIVYYPDAGEVFNISEVAGISYYLIQRVIYKNKVVQTKSLKSKILCSEGLQNSNIPILHNEAAKIIEKVVQIRKDTFTPTLSEGRYNLLVSIPPAIGGSKGSNTGYLLSKEGMLQCLAEPHVEKDSNLSLYSNNYKIIYSSINIDAVNSARSYCYSKFVRFLIFCGLVGNSTLTPETWRFVPAPEAFDHIFTDDELYKKYNLTPEEINIIESVIKERK